MMYLSFLYCLLFFLFYYNYQYETANKNVYIRGTVQSIEKDSSTNKAIVISKLKKYIIYFDNEKISIGQVIIVEGNVAKVEKQRVENGFNYELYLLADRTVAIVLNAKISLTNEYNLLLLAKKGLYDYVDSKFSGDAKSFIMALFLADGKMLSDDFKEQISINGLSHLFAVSGLHVSLFVSILLKLLSYINIKEKSANKIIDLFLLMYLIVCDMSASITRVTICFFIKQLCNRYKLVNSSLDTQSLTIIIHLFINPFIFLNCGFILSYFMAFIIILINDIIKDKNYVYSVFLISLFGLIFTFPIIINLNNEINLLSPLINVLFVYLMSFIILPLTLCTLFFPFLRNVYLLSVSCFKGLNEFISTNFSLCITFKFMNIISILLYYLLILLLIRWYYIPKKKYTILSILLIFLFIISSFNIFSHKNEIHFLDINNGDCTIIYNSDYNSVILIDTGDGQNLQVSKILKSNSIQEIDAVFITHNHIDHNGEIRNLNNEFIINKIYVSEYDNNEYSRYSNAIRVKCNDVIKLKNLQFEVLSPEKKYEDENNNSLVLFSSIFGINYLFMGDATKEIEENLKIDMKVDIIKIGHHGSNTSSSNSFLKRISPKIAIIETGRVAKFGFPHQDVIDNLDRLQIKIYRTDVDYSIIIKKNGIIKTLNTNNRIAKIFAH